MIIRLKRNEYSDPQKHSEVQFQFIEILAIKPVSYAPNRDQSYTITNKYLCLTDVGIRLLPEALIENLMEQNIYLDANTDMYEWRERAKTRPIFSKKRTGVFRGNIK